MTVGKVKDFNFSSAGKTVGLCKGGMAKKGYAEGGLIPKVGMPKVAKVVREFKAGDLHSGSKRGPVVTNPKQAVAIGLSEARAAAKKR
jgi:hypothetical protein